MKLTIIRNTALVVLLNFLTVVVLVVAQNVLQLRQPVSTSKPTEISATTIPKTGTSASTGSSNTIQQPIQQPADQTPSAAADQQIPQQPPQQTDQPAPVVDTPVPQPTADTRCIVTVRGQQFDVTQFRFIHSGGDIFSCGADMTNEFNSQHNDGIFQQLQRYRI